MLTSKEYAHRIAVVGGGAAGVTVTIRLLELSRSRHQRCEILLIDPSPSVGRGVAYSTPERGHLLNVPAGKMSVDAADPADFVRWLNRSGLPGATAEDFVPRERFGAYLEDCLDHAAAGSGTAILSRIRGRVVEAKAGADEVILHLGSPEAITVSAVVFAVGVRPPGCAWAPANLRSSERFIADPWAPGALDEVPDGEDVLLVGTGLTMVDMAMLLDRPNRVLHAVSRHGLAPRAHSSRPGLPVPPAEPDLSAAEGLPGVRRLVRRHLRTGLREQRDWRPAVDGLRPFISTLWQRLSDEDRARAVAEDAPYWEVRRHRMPPATAAEVTRLRRADRLRIGKGEVIGVTETADALHVHLTGGRSRRVGAVVNCVGDRMDVTGDPLLNNLIEAGTLRRGPLGLGLDTAADGRLLPAHGPADTPLWTLGSMRKGNLWETTAFPEIRGQAGVVAGRVLDTLHPTRRASRPRDDRGLELSTTPEAAGLYLRGLERVLCVQSGAGDAFREAVEADPGFALGHAALAALSHDVQERSQAGEAAQAAVRAARNRGDERERSFVAAVAEMVTSADGSTALLRHIEDYPRDALAVSIAVPTIAFAGVTSGEDTWRLVEGLGSAYGDDWWYRSQLAFVRQEQGRWDEAEKLSSEALDSQPSSGHAVHARTHVFYETGQHKEGLAWLDEWVRERAARSGYPAHYSWHAALHELVLGDNEAVRRRYEAQLAPPIVSGPRALVDSASMLWRCQLVHAWNGPVPIEDVLASSPGEWLERPPTTFAALHSAVALASAGDVAGLDRIRRFAAEQSRSSFERVVVPLCDGLSDVVGQRWDSAATTLLKVTPNLVDCGGSAAQREVVEDTLIRALMSADRFEEAAALLEARLDRRGSPLDSRLLNTSRAEGSVTTEEELA